MNAKKPTGSDRTKKLTPKQDKFAKEYVRTGNAAKSAENAGYSQKTARSIGQENLTKPDILKMIEVRRREIERNAELNENDVIKGLCELASVSVVDLLEETGLVNVANIKKRGWGRFIKKIEITERINLNTNEKVITTKLEGYSRLDAYKQLSDIYGLKQLPRENMQTIEKLIAAARQSSVSNNTSFEEELTEILKIVDVPAEVVKEVETKFLN